MNATPRPPVYGLVLAGGRSTRMQRDKATLTYHGRTQLEWAMALLAPHVERAFVSLRSGQNDPIRARFEQIVDTQDNLGPIAGIMAAQARYPDVAWLVLACDLPFLDDATLAYLVAARDSARQATAFRSNHTDNPKHSGLPEPLCTIYEPSSQEALVAHLAAGKDCPRKFLMDSDTLLLDQPNPHALDNVNTPKEYGSAIYRLKRGPLSTAPPADTKVPIPVEDDPTSRGCIKRIKVQYYALLREQAGRSNEEVVTPARTAHELYAELKSRYPFSLPAQMLRVAVNTEFSDWSKPLVDGDSVVFIPPVAGG